MPRKLRTRAVGELKPHREKHERSEKFDAEISEGNRRFAVFAFPALDRPSDEREIRGPRDLVFAQRAERPLWLVHGHIEWEPVDADVQEGTDTRAEKKRERRKEDFVDELGWH
jgi:hypothetical protein